VIWPHGKYGSFAIPGNHEYISGGTGFLQVLMPTLGTHPDGKGDLPGIPPAVSDNNRQKTPYWCLDVRGWRIIGLDTGFDSFRATGLQNPEIDLSEEAKKWLINVVKSAETRGLLLMMHHQAISAWYDVTRQKFPRTLAQIIGHRKVLMLWGHEHRLSFYAEQTIKYVDEQDKDSSLSFYGRCVGHGGYPVICAPPKHPAETKLVAYDDRRYRWTSPVLGAQFPAVGFNGYVVLTFKGERSNTFKANDNSTAAVNCGCTCTFRKNEEPVSHRRLMELPSEKASLVIDYYTLGLRNNVLTNGNNAHVAREHFSVSALGDVHLIKLTTAGLNLVHHFM